MHHFTFDLNAKAQRAFAMKFRFSEIGSAKAG
jgi:hypothetical protein